MAANEEKLKKPLAYMNEALEGRDHLLGGDFSLADLNVASVMTWARAGRLNLDPYPNVKAWLERCTARPALKAASGR
jgi:glutathione S-transferase